MTHKQQPNPLSIEADQIPSYYDPVMYGLERRRLTEMRRDVKAAKKAKSAELMDDLIDELEVLAMYTYARDIREAAEKTLSSIR